MPAAPGSRVARAMPPACLSSSVVLAALQAGGGGSFGSGGGFGGGGGGGGGDGELVGLLIWFCLRLVFEYPLVGVPLLLTVLATMYYGGQRGWWQHQERTIRRGRDLRRSRGSRDLASVLRSRDPAFDEGRFLERVGRAFDVAQGAWCDQDLEPLRPFVSDGVFERFSLQLEEQRAEGWRQRIDGLTVTHRSLVEGRIGSPFDTVTVRIAFSAEIHRVDLESGRRISGATLPERQFAECWTFLRKSGTRTRDQAGLMEGRCPNCGASLELNQSAHCGHCEALVKSGSFDWVLVEITQASVWRAGDEQGVPGLAAYLERDPGLSLGMLEDRASVVFWRWAASDRRGSILPLSRVSSPAFCEAYGPTLAADEHGQRRSPADRAVGSVRTLGVVPGEDLDRVLVEVHWDGREATFGPDGQASLEKRRQMRRTVLILGRRPGGRTDVETSFTTAHCGTCGAADDGSTEAECPYCQSPRTGDRHTWLLHELAERHWDRTRELLTAANAPASAVPPAPSEEGLLAWAATLIHADGGMSEGEERGFRRLAQRLEVPRARAEALLEAPHELGDMDPVPAGRAEPWLDSLIGLALEDGRISADERRLLDHAAAELGLAKGSVQARIKAARSRLYRETRAAR